MLSIIFDFIIPFAVVLGVLVFIHELGHYFAAKIFGMRVDAFSLGFPPRAWGFRWSTKKLRLKFIRDIQEAIVKNQSFGRIHALLAQNGINRSAQESIKALDKAFLIEQELVEKEMLDKKGKPFKGEEVVTNVKFRPVPDISENVSGQIQKEFTDDAELIDLFRCYAEINDDKTFREKYQTDYCLSWIPLGGYCKINGMVDESLDLDAMKEGPPKPWEYRAKPIWQRIIAITGGVAFNFLLAALIFGIMGFARGLPDVDKYNEYKLGTQISAVMEKSPAEKAGLKPGDKIIAINGKNVSEWKDLVEVIHANAGNSIVIEWKRGEEILTASIVPNANKIQTIDGPKEVGQIGISPSQLPEFVRDASFFEALGYGFKNTAGMTAYMLMSIKQMITGEQSIKEALGGPIAIFRATGEVKQQYGWEGIWNLMALLSISLAVFNLFPIPALDGGHLVFLFIEGIIRRPISIKVKLYTQQAGMAILLTFIIYVIFNDILKWTGN